MCDSGLLPTSLHQTKKRKAVKNLPTKSLIAVIKLFLAEQEDKFSHATNNERRALCI